MDFLKVNNNSGNLPSSPSNSFIADEIASICPLITPSPPTNDLINPLPEPIDANFTIGDELATRLQQVKDDDKGADSASSSSSALAEPACTQLLHRNTYHHITKDEHTVAEETNGKLQSLQLTFKNPPENYFFMSWNWPLIRKISLWLFLSGLIAMLALVIAMIVQLPKTCNPETEWYQGSVMYEIFPASFQDTNNDMIGDFKGITKKIDYLQSLGVRSVRLNSIFQSYPSYPEHYRNATSLIEIAPHLGTIDDFVVLAKRLHSKNISLILDLPVFPVVKQLTIGPNFIDLTTNSTTNQEPSVEFLKASHTDPVEQALIYWLNNGVDGFYLKGLENFVDHTNFGKSLRHWKRVLGPVRPIIVSQDVINNCPKSSMNIVLNNVDLVDVRLEIENGEHLVSKQLKSVMNSTLFSRPGMPWILWTLGDATTPRLANILPYSNATLGATLLQLMLPGTPSIFYGNEIGLKQIHDPNGERKDIEHLHQLAAMVWQNEKSSVLPWMYGEKTSTNFEQIQIVAKMVELRHESASIYINAVYKEGDNRANAEVKYSRGDLLVVQRWYPRRKSFVVASNLGNNQITADLSTLLYSGVVMIGPQIDSKSGSVSFKDISLWPGESVVISLD